VPIIFLTAKAMEEDTLQGFKVGADDYLTKPFSMEVLVARMEAVLRRSQSDKELPSLADEIALGNYMYFPQKMRLMLAGQEQKFTPKENDLMKLLCENLGRPVSRSYALKLIWGDDTYFNARSMDVYMTKLRKMLKEDPRVQLMNLHGEGFRLSIEGIS
jgi:DNA-binding response OmpR family regulator